MINFFYFGSSAVIQGYHWGKLLGYELFGFKLHFFSFFGKRIEKKTVQNRVYMTPSFLFSAELSPDTYCTLLVFWSNINETSLDMFEHVFWCLGSGFVKNVGNDQGFERIRREEEKKKTKIQLIYESLFLFIAIHYRLFLLVVFYKRDKKWA